MNAYRTLASGTEVYVDATGKAWFVAETDQYDDSESECAAELANEASYEEGRLWGRA